jgi:hypothetical protein
MKRAPFRWSTPALVGGFLLVVCATEAWQIARLHARHGEITRELAASPGAAPADRPAGSPALAAAGSVGAEMDRGLAEATAELTCEKARRSVAEAKLKAAEADMPQLKDEELRSLGHIEQFALGAAEWLDALVQFDSEIKNDLDHGKELSELDPKTAEFLSTVMRWQGKIAVIAEMEDTPAEIGKFHASTIGQRLNLDGPTLIAVRTQIEKEFTDLAAAQLTESFCPKVNAGDWQKRRAAAMAEATKRVEALIPPARNRPDVVAQSLSLGDAIFSNVSVGADGHGSANFGIRIPGLKVIPGTH